MNLVNVKLKIEAAPQRSRNRRLADLFFFSLAFVIGVLELTLVAQGLNNRLMVYPFEIYTTVAFLYFICCYAMSQYARRLEARLSPEKQSLVM